jgi:hypothetical protein
MAATAFFATSIPKFDNIWNVIFHGQKSSGVEIAKTNQNFFRFRRAAFYSQLKSSTHRPNIKQRALAPFVEGALRPA